MGRWTSRILNCGRRVYVLLLCLALLTTFCFEDSARQGLFSSRTTRHPSSALFQQQRQDFSSSSSSPVQHHTLESVAKGLAESRFSNVIVLMGAGASVSAGIPDFRTPGTGLYDSLQHYNLPFPEAIFDLDYYKQNPFPFIDLCQSIWPGLGPTPTLTHAFGKLLQDRGCLRRIYTQNIDGLEAMAGVSTDKLVECHGHFRSAACVACHRVADIETCQREIFQGTEPVCRICGGLVKPDVVFFGEELPSRFRELIDDDVGHCDLLIVIGTSLQVMPVAGIPSWVGPNCPRILLNRELVGQFSISGGNSGRDIYLEGECDDSVKKLAQLAGWGEDLATCHESVQSGR